MSRVVSAGISILALMIGLSGARGDCLGDLDGDCLVDGADIGLFLVEWGKRSSDADFNGDGLVDGFDFGILLAAKGKCIDCSGIDHVHGDIEILADLHDGGASLLMMGDSISNWGSTNFTSLYHAAICTWKPLQWRGIHTSCQASSPQGHYVISGESSGPGEIPAFPGTATDLTGHYTAIAESFRRPAGSEAGTVLFTAGIKHSIFSASASARPALYRIGRPFENAAGVVDFVNTPGEIEMGFSFLANGYISAQGHAYARDMMARAYRGSVVEASGMPVAPALIEGPGTVGTRFRWFSGGMSSTDPALLSRVEIAASERALRDEVAVVQDFYFGRTGRPQGLSIAYAGDGGWRVGNHLHSAGSSQAPPVGGGRPGYSDIGLGHRIGTIDASHYFIHLGTNDFSPGRETTPEQYQVELEALIERLRVQHEAISSTKPGFIILGLYLTDSDDESVIRPRKDKARSLMIAHVQEADDLVYLDLAGHLENIFDLSDIDVSNPFADEWLLDGVHLNPTGAEGIGAWIWSKVAAAVAARGR